MRKPIATDPSANVELEERDPQPTLNIRQTVLLSDLPQAQGESLATLWKVISEAEVTPAGAPYVRYHTFGSDETDVEVGIPVASATAGVDRVQAGELPGGPTFTTWHLGSHDTLAGAYDRLQAGISEHGREVAGSGWEVYEWIDPTVEPDPATWPPPESWRTQLIQPVT